MKPRLFLIAATALLLQVAPSWSASEAAKSSGLPRGGDDRPEGVRDDPAHLCPPTLEPPIPPIPTTVQQALEYISMLYPGSAADPGAVMQTVPGVMDYLDKKKRESYYEEVKTFKTNLDVVRECRCENSLMTLDVAKARVAAARGPADQAVADRRLKLAMDQKKSDCDVSGDANPSRRPLRTSGVSEPGGGRSQIAGPPSLAPSKATTAGHDHNGPAGANVLSTTPWDVRVIQAA